MQIGCGTITVTTDQQAAYTAGVRGQKLAVLGMGVEPWPWLRGHWHTERPLPEGWLPGEHRSFGEAASQEAGSLRGGRVVPRRGEPERAWTRARG